MKDNKLLNNIKFTKIIVKILTILSFVLSIIFTSVGTVVITLLVKYLYQVLNFNYLVCLLIVFTLPGVYSTIINSFLKYVDNKTCDILSKIDFLEQEQVENYSLSNEQCLNDIRLRYEKLTIDSQLKVLKFIKDNIPMVTKFEELNQEDMLLLMQEIDNIEVYSKKMSIQDRKKWWINALC